MPTQNPCGFSWWAWVVAINTYISGRDLWVKDYPDEPNEDQSQNFVVTLGKKDILWYVYCVRGKCDPDDSAGAHHMEKTLGGKG